MQGSFDFTGKKVIITGAVGVFGTWIAQAFDNAGAELWLVDKDKVKLEKLKQFFSEKSNIKISNVNLTKEDQIIHFYEEVNNFWKGADFLINNAGVYPNNIMLDLETEQWDEVMDTNVKAPFLMTKFFSKLLISQEKPGVIINIISKSAKIPRMGAVHYATSKAALEMMTRGHSMELAKYHIRVNAVSPGFAPGSDVNDLSNEYVTAMKNKIPLGRFSESEDASQTILFLCSDNASFITGSSIYVDGGNSAGDFHIPMMDTHH